MSLHVINILLICHLAGPVSVRMARAANFVHVMCGVVRVLPAYVHIYIIYVDATHLCVHDKWESHQQRFHAKH